MITLIIDTSTEKSVVSFAQGGYSLLNFLLPPGVHSSRYLMQTIESGFKQLNLSPLDLVALSVGVGPGSYTGIRVGAAAAYGLAFPRSLPLIGFCSLEGFISQKPGFFVSITDARIGGSYVLLQHNLGGEIVPLGVPQLMCKDELDSYLSQYPEQAGPHIDYPDTAHLARLSEKKLQQGEYSSHLDLIYLRNPYSGCLKNNI